MEQVINISGEKLTIENIYDIVKNPKIKIRVTKSAIVGIKKARRFLETDSVNKIIYGVNTGFGPMASYIIGKNQIEKLQENLILGHAVGMGEPVKKDFVLAVMVIRLNTLTKGYSGVSVELIERLETFINNRIIPVVPEHGAVGTSGDLTQLSHIALALIGEGDVFYKGIRQKTSRVLKKLRIKKFYKLKSKEGLSLINGTAMMSGIGALLVKEAEHITGIAIQTSALSLELVNSISDYISESLHLLRPHDGQIYVAKVMRKILKTSRLLKSRNVLKEHVQDNGEDIYKIDNNVQEIYSLRCAPQILGPIVDAIRNVRKVIEIEINSVTDNPVVDVSTEQFMHGGNFHGDYVAVAMDQLKVGLVKLTILLERKINFFQNHRLNKQFPPFLNIKSPGLSMGLQGLQFVATSTTALNQSYAYPHSIHSISTNADNQDVVSMGTDAALIADKVVENLYTVLTIEMITLTQAVDFLGAQSKLSDTTRALFRGTRKQFPKIHDDRVIVDELEDLKSFIKNIPKISLD